MKNYCSQTVTLSLFIYEPEMGSKAIITAATYLPIVPALDDRL
jgi:hypothetical protein